jgi:hypothetical protein
MTLLAFVDLDDLFRVDRKPDVRVHNHAEQAGVSLEEKSDQDYWKSYLTLQVHIFE